MSGRDAKGVTAYGRTRDQEERYSQSFCHTRRHTCCPYGAAKVYREEVFLPPAMYLGFTCSSLHGVYLTYRPIPKEVTVVLAPCPGELVPGFVPTFAPTFRYRPGYKNRYIPTLLGAHAFRCWQM
ncbi:MAG: hypothetical protein JWR01_2961 [Subtercola sp.]|nr:hypothetical protein [Subtercola sp.]